MRWIAETPDLRGLCVAAAIAVAVGIPTLLLAPDAARAGALFSGATSFAAGDVPHFVAATDLDGDKIVVANRTSGTISVIREAKDQVIVTLGLAYDARAGEPLPAPMYVVYTRSGKRVFVGDRANRRIVAFDASDLSLLETIPGGDGIFHMWADPQGRQLWVVNNVENTVTVVDVKTSSVLTTIPIPADLVADGRVPHDVMLDRGFAYVTLVASLGGGGGGDHVVKYSLDTFEEVARRQVGVSPSNDSVLYLPTQNSNTVTVLNRDDLSLVTEIPVPGAHGAAFPRNGNTFYTTNIPGGQIDTLFAIDTRTNAVIGEPVVTHSGFISNKVTVWSISNQDPVPILLGDVTVGLNPFGIALVP